MAPETSGLSTEQIRGATPFKAAWTFILGVGLSLFWLAYLVTPIISLVLGCVLTATGPRAIGVPLLTAFVGFNLSRGYTKIKARLDENLRNFPL